MISLSTNARRFLSDAFTLSSATGVAQIVALLAAPVLTRLYTPDDFGMFSVYASILSLVVVVACLRYELAITLPEENSSALALLSLSVFAVLLLTFGCGVGVYLFGDSLGAWFGLKDQKFLLTFLPMSLLLAGLYKAGSYWAIRTKSFRIVAVSKISQSSTQTVTQIVLGVLSLGAFGLVIGELLGKVLANVALWIGIRRDDSANISHVTVAQLKFEASRYRKFPLISSWSAMINQAGGVAPTLLLAGLYGPVVAGWYALVQRVLAMPMDLVGQSIQMLYFGEASELIRKNTSALRRLFLKSAAGLFLLGLIPASLLFFFGDTLFAFVFGEEWRQAGVFSQILSVAFLFRFAISPLTQTLNIIERQDLQLIWDACRLVAVVGVLAAVYLLERDAGDALAAYVAVVVVSQVSYAALALAQFKRLLS